MLELKSSITGLSMSLADAREKTESAGFVLGGNWEYDHGCFDKALDQQDIVWLRIPFDVTQVNLDSERENLNATIRFGAPFVLKHVYEEGIDSEAASGLLSSFVNQFQTPADPDDKVEPHWVERAEAELRELEQILR